MNKKKAILAGIAVVIATVVLIFGAMILLVWIMESSDEYSRGG